MAISSEFAKTVQEKNVLRTRIMLKDSLLVDKSFSKYKELLTYAEEHDFDVWKKQEDPIEPADKSSWTPDLMNYELTALVNDFTKAHVQYVQEIITEVYKGERAQGNRKSSQPLETGSRPRPRPKPSTSDSRKNKSNTNDISYKTIEDESEAIEKIVCKSKNKSWRFDDIEKIKDSARRIKCACEEILRREQHGTNIRF
jgi:hypothetical protein